jgi:hypothetical protein
MISNNAEAIIVHKQVGDGWGITRTDVIREFPFPESHVGSHYPELIIWNRMGRKYDAIYMNDVLQTTFYDTANSITRNELAADSRKLADKVLRESAAYLNGDFRYFPRAPMFFVKRALLYNYYFRNHAWRLADDQRLEGWVKVWCWLFRPLHIIAEFAMKRKKSKTRMS